MSDLETTLQELEALRERIPEWERLLAAAAAAEQELRRQIEQERQEARAREEDLARRLAEEQARARTREAELEAQLALAGEQLAAVNAQLAAALRRIAELEGGAEEPEPGPATLITAVEILGEARGPAILTFAHPFRRGELPRDQRLLGRLDGKPVPLQLTPKASWDGGSVRHGLVAARVDGPGRLELLVGAARRETAPALPLPRPERLVARAVVDGITYTFLPPPEPTEVWSAGPLVAETRWLGELVDREGQPHPQLAALVDVRADADGRRRLSIALESTWHDQPGNLNYNAELGPEGDVASFEGVTHYHHARWRRVAWDGPAPPAYQVRHDARYLAAAGAVPAYDPRRKVPKAAIDRLHEHWQKSNRKPLGNGLIHAQMPHPGGRGDIGPAPAWVVLALLSGDARAWEIALDTADRAGSFSVHYRDRATGRPYSIADHPTASLVNPGAARPADRIPATGGSSPYDPDGQHQPNPVYVPYLLLGDPFHLDELYFWTQWNFLGVNSASRGHERGILGGATVPTRSQAWRLRTLANAAFVAPDGHPEAGRFDAALRENIRWFEENMVPANQLGAWGRVTFDIAKYPAEVAWMYRPWQNDFLAIVLGWLVAMGYPAERIAAWSASNCILRHRNLRKEKAHQYDLAGGDKEHKSWYQDWQEVDRLTPDSKSWRPGDAFHYQAHARAAMAAAVDLGLPGAPEAYQEMDAILEQFGAEYDADPTWAIVPRTAIEPAREEAGEAAEKEPAELALHGGR